MTNKNSNHYVMKMAVIVAAMRVSQRIAKERIGITEAYMLAIYCC